MNNTPNQNYAYHDNEDTQPQKIVRGDMSQTSQQQPVTQQPTTFNNDQTPYMGQAQPYMNNSQTWPETYQNYANPEEYYTEETEPIKKGIPVLIFIIAIIAALAIGFFIGRASIDQQVIVQPIITQPEVTQAPSEIAVEPTAEVAVEIPVVEVEPTAEMVIIHESPTAVVEEATVVANEIVRPESSQTEEISNNSQTDAADSGMMIVRSTATAIPVFNVGATSTPAAMTGTATINAVGDVGALLLDKPNLNATRMQTLFNGAEVELLGDHITNNGTTFLKVKTNKGYEGWVLDFVIQQ